MAIHFEPPAPYEEDEDEGWITIPLDGLQASPAEDAWSVLDPYRCDVDEMIAKLDPPASKRCGRG